MWLCNNPQRLVVPYHGIALLRTLYFGYRSNGGMSVKCVRQEKIPTALESSHYYSGLGSFSRLEAESHRYGR